MSDKPVSTVFVPPDENTADYWERDEVFRTWFDTYFTGGWVPGSVPASNDPESDATVGTLLPATYMYLDSWGHADNVVIVACLECGAALPLHLTWAKPPVHLNAHRTWHDKAAGGSH